MAGFEAINNDRKPFQEGFTGGAHIAANIAQPPPPQMFGDNTGVHLTDKQKEVSVFC